MRKLLILGVLLAGCSPSPQTTPPSAGAPTQISVSTPEPTAAVEPSLQPTTPPATAVSTQTATSPQEPAATAGSAGGREYRFEQIRLSVPAGLPVAISGTAVPRTAGEDAPSWAKLPSHTALQLSNYPVERSPGDVSIRVYPAAEFAQISPEAAQQIDQLKRLLTARPQAPEDPLPQLPPTGAVQQFQARFGYVDFQNGSGIRFLTQLAQDVGPVTNERLLYIYQGITADGMHYVSASLPISAPFLPNDTQAAPPQGGLPFPDYGAGDFQSQYQTYRQAVVARLDAAPARELAPDLDLLDALISSIRIE